ncbi:hypothetical protein LTR66_015170 [Elasticomyces elasticus]|nr:hypothetical protein LTR66_015170 [Elasticomyces elasticus]
MLSLRKKTPTSDKSPSKTPAADLPNSKPSRPPSMSFSRSPLVVLYVGEERQAFTVHRDILVGQSQYFRALLLGGFKEAETNEVIWDNEQVDAVETMITFLYKGTLPTEMHSTTQAAVDHILNYYTLALKRDLPAFQNALSRNYRQFNKAHPCGQAARLVEMYDRDLLETQMWKYAIAMFVYDLMAVSTKTHPEKITYANTEFKCELAEFSNNAEVMQGVLALIVEWRTKPWSDPSNTNNEAVNKWYEVVLDDIESL